MSMFLLKLSREKIVLSGKLRIADHHANKVRIN